MMQLRLARSASRLAPSFGTRFASTLDPSSGLKYDPEKGPKGAYIPADPRKPSDSAKTLFKKCVAWGWGMVAERPGHPKPRTVGGLAKGFFLN